MAVTRFEIRSREPFEDGRSFGDVGAYERIDGVLHYAVDPGNPANAEVVDIERAERDSSGAVRFEADVTLLGKALSGGFYPVSAVLSNSEVLGVLEPGQHGSTFGGNPLACAVARMALKVLTDEGMIENAAKLGPYFLDGLAGIKSNHIKSVRGRGLMLAIDLHPEAGGARQFCYALRDQGILAKDTHTDTIRIAPPLVITKDQIDDALEKFDAVLSR